MSVLELDSGSSDWIFCVYFSVLFRTLVTKFVSNHFEGSVQYRCPLYLRGVGAVQMSIIFETEGAFVSFTPQTLVTCDFENYCLLLFVNHMARVSVCGSATRLADYCK